MQEKILIIGCGDIGKAVAHELIKLRHQVTAIKRNPPKKKSDI